MRNHLLKKIYMKKQKPEIFDRQSFLTLQELDPTSLARNEYELPATAANFALNSLGAPHRNAERYCEIFFEHWKVHQVEGHFEPMIGIGANPTGYANFREMFREFAVRLLGAKNESETAIVNDQSTTYSLLLRWLLEDQLNKSRNVVLYEESAFPSDRQIIQTISEIVTQYTRENEWNTRKPVCIKMPETPDGLLDHKELLELIKKHKDTLAVVAFGSGGVHWKTAQLLDLQAIGTAVKNAGGKLLVNAAHAIGIAELNLHENHVSAAVGCLYKFMSAGPGGPSLVFIHEDECTTFLPTVGWFSFENPIAALQGKHPSLKTGAQRIEASNPQVLGWLPAFAALEYYCSIPQEQIWKKSALMLTYFDELMESIQDAFHKPIKVITPKGQRSTEIVFTTENSALAPELHTYLNKNKIICDIRDGNRIRIGMFPLITSFEEINMLFNAMWNFFEEK
jgi:kynureninase